jgi:hypothetical protein
MFSDLSLMKFLPVIIAIVLSSCSTYRSMPFPSPTQTSISGSEFYKQAAAYNWQQRDSLAVQEILGGSIPSFLKKFVPVTVTITDSTGKKLSATYYVAPDYLSIGNNNDWCRIPLTPMAAQKIADSLDCFLPTRKMADDIYKAASVKPEPVPMFAFRDSTPTFYQHHLIIEGQRKQRSGLIAGIKKDVVISGILTRGAKMQRVAIYGWHKTDGKPIQPLYAGHVNWYVDYSHGIRLVYRKIRIGNKWMDYTDILSDAKLSKLLCDEEYCDFYKYPY